MNWNLATTEAYVLKHASRKRAGFILLLSFFLSAPWTYSQPADNREWINNFIAEINTDLQAAGTMVGKNSYTSARDKLRQTAEKLRGEIGHFAALVQENKEAYPDWEVDTFVYLPAGLNASLYEMEHNVFANKYEREFVPKLEEAELRMKQRQLLGAVQIMSTALVTFVEAYNTATGTDTLSAGALYLFGSDLQSMAADAKQRAEDIEVGLLKVNNAKQAYQELYDLGLRLQDMRRRLLEGARIAKALESEMKGVRELVDYYRSALAEAQSITLPAEVAQPSFSATPYIEVLNNLMTGLNTLKLPWGDATSLANKTYARADADYAAYTRSQPEAAEWDRFSTKWTEWEALLAQRNADLASLNSKVAAIQSLLDGIKQDYTAIVIPPTPLTEELQGLGFLPNVDEALIGVIDTPWQSGVRWSNDTDATQSDDSTGKMALSYISPYWARPNFMAGEQAAIDYIQNLWSRKALRWANATRASVASQGYNAWASRPHRWDAQAFSVSILDGNQLRTVRDNLFTCQDEATAFTTAWEDISSNAASIAARRTEIEELALALSLWLEERPVTLPAAEMAYRIRFIGLEGEQVWIRFDSILSKIAQLGIEAPLVAAAVSREAEWLHQKCQLAIDLVEDDIAFNSTLSGSGEKAVRAADMLLMFRDDYQGNHYPGYLYNVLDDVNDYLKAHFLPHIYTISINNEPIEDHSAYLRLFLDYLDSLPSWSLSNFTEWLSEVRKVSDQLINARWLHLEYYGWSADMDAYHRDGGRGRLVFPENREMVDAIINTRWGGSRSNLEPGKQSLGRTWGEDAGFLSMAEIRLGLPKLHNFVASLPNPDGGSTPPPAADYSISQGPSPYLSENGRTANQVKVSVTQAGNPAPARTPVVCEFDLGAALPMRLLAFTDEAAEAHFTLDFTLPAGALALSFSIDNQDLLTWNVSVDRDSDGDGLGDSMELQLGMDPDFSWDGLLDSDGDGLSDTEELLLGTDPNQSDTDGDGVSDGDEIAAGTDPLRPSAPHYADDPILAPPTRVVGRDWITLGELPLGEGLELPSPYWNPGELIYRQLAAMGRIWLFTQTQSPNPFAYRVWWTGDGETWEMAPVSFPQDFQPVHIFQFDDQLASMDSFGKVCLSPDGIEWTLLSNEAAPWAVQDGYSGRSGFGITVFNGQLHIAGGRGITYPTPAYLSDHWTSSDGINWTQVSASLDFLQNRKDFFMGATQGKLVIAFGSDTTADNDYTGFYGVMVSEDGITWELGAGAWQLPSHAGAGPWMRGRFYELSGSLYLETEGYDYRLSRHFQRFRWTGQVWAGLEADSGYLPTPPPVPFLGALWDFDLPNTRYHALYSGNLLGFEPVYEEQFPVYANARHIAAGSSHALVIALDGSLWAWGDNTSGQLGQGHNNLVETAVPIGERTDWKQVAAGQASSYALTADGDLYAWGYNGSGQLGLGDQTVRSIPERVGLAGEWADVQAGDYHVVAIKTDGSVWTWGSNSSGQLGVPTGSTGIYSSPNPVQPQTLAGLSYVRAVAAGKFSAAIGQGGDLSSSKYWGQRTPPNYNPTPLTFPWNDFPVSPLHWVGQNFYLSPSGSAGNNIKRFGLNRTWAALAGTFESGLGIQFNNTLMAWDLDWPEPRLIGEDHDWIAVVKRASSDAYLLQKADGSFWSLQAGTGTPQPIAPFGPNYALDLDRDGLPDYWERRYASADWTDQADAALDVASDGLTALEEFAAGTNPDLWDTDGDGLGDGYELRFGGDPLKPLQADASSLQWVSEWVPANWQEEEPLFTAALHRSGDRLFADMNGLRIIDMSDPTEPTELGYWNAEVDFDHVSGTLFLQDFAVQGDHLLIATGSTGWLLMDMADPANLEMIATGFEHECGQLAVDGEWIAMGEQWQRSAVHIYRWDASGLPVKITAIPTDYYEGKIALGNGLLAIPGATGGILLYQLIEGAEPELVAEWASEATVDSMVWHGDLLYATGSEPSGATKLWFLKFENGALASVKPAQEFTSTRHDNWLTLSATSNQLVHLQRSSYAEPGSLSVAAVINPLSPVWSSPFSGDVLTEIWNPSFTIFGNYLLFARGDGGIQVLEILTTDHDGDGLPDDWEIAQFGDLRYSGEDDPDNDGLSNFLEYHVGTDPLRADSNGDGMSDGDSVRFGFNPLGSVLPPALPPQTRISAPAQGMLRLEFDPGGDASVILESSTDLIEWTPVEIAPALNGSHRQWDISLPNDPSRFYRIRH